MRDKKLIRKLTIMAMLFSMALAVIRPLPAEAASATIEIATEKNTYRTDESFEVTVTLTSDVLPGRVLCCITYNTKLVKYVSGPACATRDYNEITIDDSGIGTDKSTRQYVFHFKTKAEGEAVFGFKGSAEVADAAGNTMPVATLTTTVAIEDPKAATPTPVPTPTAAVGSDQGVPVKVGDQFRIVSSDVAGWAFYAIEGDGGVDLIADAKYRVCTDSTGVEIPSGYSKTSIVVSGYTITAYAPTDNVKPEFILLILCKEEGNPQVYCYDRVEKTIQRYHETLADRDDQSSLQSLTARYQKTLGNLTVLIMVLFGMCLMLLVVTIRLTLKRRSRQQRIDRSI